MDVEEFLRSAGKGGGGSSSRPRISGGAGYRSGATSLLTGDLKKIKKGGSVEDFLRASDIAKGNHPSLATRGLEGVGMVLGLPLRGVVASGSRALGLRNKGSYWQNLIDPSYGAGRVIEQNAPDLPMWAKRGAGLVGDLAFDPLTYASFGGSAALKEAGRGAGLARIAYNESEKATVELGARKAAQAAAEAGVESTARAGEQAARDATSHVSEAFKGLSDDEVSKLADDWGELASRTEAKGAHKLSNDELDRLAQAKGLQPGAFRYGVGYHVPFGRYMGLGDAAEGNLLTKGPGEWYGRTLEGAGGKISRTLRETRVGGALSGNMTGILRMAQSGDTPVARGARRLYDALQGGKGIHSRVETELSRMRSPLIRDARKAGLDPFDITQALREAPTTVDGVTSEGGPMWEKLKDVPAFKQFADHYAKMPDYLKGVAAARGATGNIIARDVVHDATEAGRPYAPGLLSDDFKATMREKRRANGKVYRQGGRTEVTDPVWMQKKALTVGDKMGDGEFERELIRPGTIDPNTGEMAGTLEQQKMNVIRAQFGENAVDWYENDAFKVLAKYHEGVAEAARNTHVRNQLEAHGLSNEKYTWLPDEASKTNPKLTVRERATKARAIMKRVDDDIGTATDRLRRVNDQIAALKGKKIMGEAANKADEALFEKYSIEQAAAHRQLRDIEAGIPDARRRAAAAVKEDAKAQVVRDAAEADYQNFLPLHQQAVDNLAKAEAEAADAPNGWQTLKDAVAAHDESTRKLRELATNQQRLGGLYKDAAHGYATAKELERVLAQGGVMDPEDPLHEVAQHMADKLNVPLDEEGMKQVAAVLRGSADRSMEELHGIASEVPGTANPNVIRGQLSGSTRKMTKAGQQMMEATTDVEYEAARQAYDDAAKAAAHQRNLLSLHRATGGAPTLDDMDKAVADQLEKHMAARAELASQTSASARDRAMASLDVQREQWIGRGGDPEAVLPNPSATEGPTWWHGAKSGDINIEGQFPLEQAMREADYGGYVDYLMSPSTASGRGFSDSWVYSDPAKVHEMVFHASPDRVIVIGPGHSTFADLEAITGEQGLVLRDAADALEAMRNGTGYGGAGPAYSMLAGDSVRRVMDEQPGVLEEFVTGMTKAAGGWMEGPQRIADIFQSARNVQDYLTGVGEHANFDEALEAVTKWVNDTGGKALDFPLAHLHEPGVLPNPGDYMPHVRDVSRAVFESKWADQPFRERMVNALRESYQRDGDVIAFVNTEKNSQGLPIVEALPTHQFAISKVMRDTADEVVGHQGVAGQVEAVRQTYTGKLVDGADVARYEDSVRAANNMVNDIHSQFSAAQHDAAKAQGLAAQAEGDLNRALAEKSKLTAGMQERKAERDQAVVAFQARVSATDELSGRLHTLEGKRASLAAELAPMRSERAYAAREGERADALVKIMGAAHEGFGFNMEAPSSVVQGLADVNRAFDPVTGEGLRPFLKQFDAMTRYMKGWLVATPAFQLRNLFGGLFNNHLANVDLMKAGPAWGDILFRKFTPKALQEAELAGEALPKGATWGQKLAHDFIMDTGVTRSGLYHSELGNIASGSNLLAGGSLNPMAGIAGGDKAFVAPTVVHRLGEQAVEPFLRGQLAWDRLDKAIARGRYASVGVRSLKDVNAENYAQVLEAVKGSALRDEVTAEINKYHFDYEDLSHFERNVVRRVIPFYTWTRKNVPLQLEAMFTQPGKFINQYMAVKRNLELGTTPESVVPSYFREMSMIHLPFSGKGGEAYGTVDLPFKDPFKVMDVTGQLTGMLNPWIKAPLESWAGKQFFNDVPIKDTYSPLPKSWLPLLPAIKALSVLPFVPVDSPVKGKGGQWMVRDKTAYVIQQYLPFMQQTRRLLPSEPKYQNRLATSIASYLGGVNVRTNTVQDQENEIFRRADELNSMVADLKATGRIKTAPKRAKRVASTSLQDQLANIGA